MNEQPGVPLAAIRTEPIQQRSSERITLLLDTAAELIDENGIDGLTTSDVAARSRSSVGVVYRYFPNIQSLLRALATRNKQRFLDTAFSALSGAPTDWLSELDKVIDLYSEFTRREPGFRALHFGGVIDDRFMESDGDVAHEIAARFAGVMSERYGLPSTAALALDIDMAIQVGAALLQRAFRVDRDGDERYIAKARQVMRELLEPHRARAAMGFVE
jgi:AcrR family transcriptional regulator